MDTNFVQQDINRAVPNFHFYGSESFVKNRSVFNVTSILPTVDDELPLGWFTFNDCLAYRELYSSLPDNSKTVEIGVWQGRSICSVAREISKKKIKVFAVDTFKGNISAPDVVHSCNGHLFQIFQSNIEKFGIANFIQTINLPSYLAAPLFPPKSLDLVFIDADHSFEMVCLDILSWLSLLKPGAILSGHDYNWAKEAVRICLRKYSIQVSQDSDIWWTRI